MCSYCHRFCCRNVFRNVAQMWPWQSGQRCSDDLGTYYVCHHTVPSTHGPLLAQIHYARAYSVPEVPYWGHIWSKPKELPSGLVVERSKFVKHSGTQERTLYQSLTRFLKVQVVRSPRFTGCNIPEMEKRLYITYNSFQIYCNIAVFFL